MSRPDSRKAVGEALIFWAPAYRLFPDHRRGDSRPPADGSSKKEPAIGDGSQSRERTRIVSRFPAALCVEIHTENETLRAAHLQARSNQPHRENGMHLGEKLSSKFSCGRFPSLAWRNIGGAVFNGQGIEVFAMSLENPSRRRSWPRVVAISLLAFGARLALSVLTFEDGPGDTPLIKSVLSN